MTLKNLKDYVIVVVRNLFYVVLCSTHSVLLKEIVRLNIELKKFNRTKGKGYPRVVFKQTG